MNEFLYIIDDCFQIGWLHCGHSLASSLRSFFLLSLSLLTSCIANSRRKRKTRNCHQKMSQYFIRFLPSCYLCLTQISFVLFVLFHYFVFCIFVFLVWPTVFTSFLEPIYKHFRSWKFYMSCLSRILELQICEQNVLFAFTHSSFSDFVILYFFIMSAICWMRHCFSHITFVWIRSMELMGCE